MTNGHPDWDLIGRYLAGEATADEQAIVRQWLAAHPEEARLLAIVDGAASTMAPPLLSDFEVESALRRVKARRDVVRPRRSFRHPAWIAAAVLAALGIWVTMRGREHSDAFSPPPVAQVTTTSGQVQTLKLADGSRIVVAPNSEVKVSRGRFVTLRGQAYFDVVHNESRSFWVNTDVARIRDLGTAFEVQEDTLGAVTVDVTSGIVELRALRDTAQGVTLRKGDRGRVQRGGKPTAERGRAPTAPNWTTGRLVFENASMDEVKSGLRRWYGITLQVHDSTMMNRHLTATFGSESPDQVLRIIALAVGGSVERRGNVAILHSAPQPATR